MCKIFFIERVFPELNSTHVFPCLCFAISCCMPGRQGSSLEGGGESHETILADISYTYRSLLDLPDHAARSVALTNTQHTSFALTACTSDCAQGEARQGFPLTLPRRSCCQCVRHRGHQDCLHNALRGQESAGYAADQVYRSHVGGTGAV
jgi:hypothetical protein